MTLQIRRDYLTLSPPGTFGQKHWHEDEFRDRLKMLKKDAQSFHLRACALGLEGSYLASAETNRTVVDN